MSTVQNSYSEINEKIFKINKENYKNVLKGITNLFNDISVHYQYIRGIYNTLSYSMFVNKFNNKFIKSTYDYLAKIYREQVIKEDEVISVFPFSLRYPIQKCLLEYTPFSKQYNIFNDTIEVVRQYNVSEKVNSDSYFINYIFKKNGIL